MNEQDLVNMVTRQSEMIIQLRNESQALRDMLDEMNSAYCRQIARGTMGAIAPPVPYLDTVSEPG